MAIASTPSRIYWRAAHPRAAAYPAPYPESGMGGAIGASLARGRFPGMMKGNAMPKFIIETTAEAVIREFWQIEAATAEDARDSFHDGESYQLLWDETIGDEQNREVAHVHPARDLDGIVAMHRAQQAGPAMLAALRLAADALSPARNAKEAGVLRSIQLAIAAATGER